MITVNFLFEKIMPCNLTHLNCTWKMWLPWFSLSAFMPLFLIWINLKKKKSGKNVLIFRSVFDWGFNVEYVVRLIPGSEATQFTWGSKSKLVNSLKKICSLIPLAHWPQEEAREDWPGRRIGWWCRDWLHGVAPRYLGITVVTLSVS